MPSTLANCYNSVVTTLTNDTTLSTYVKAVYEGVRENIPHNKMPCLCVEPALLEETNIWIERGDLWFTVYVIGYTYAQKEVKDQIVGTGTRKGVIDFQEDTLFALRNNQTLDGYAIEWDCGRIAYEFRIWPVRGFLMEVKIHTRRNY